MAKHITPFRYPEMTFQIIWLSHKTSNLTKGKIYTANAMSRAIGGDRYYSNFHVTDNDGDAVALNANDENKKWKIVTD